MRITLGANKRKSSRSSPRHRMVSIELASWWPNRPEQFWKLPGRPVLFPYESADRDTELEEHVEDAAENEW